MKLLLDPTEAAESMGISERHLRDLTRDGRVPFVLLGRSVRYSPAALERWAIAESYARLEEGGDASATWRGTTVEAKERRALGRGRPRAGRTAEEPLRFDPRRPFGQAG